MSAGSITAGEAYVSVTCDNSELDAGLREASAAIMSTARRIASMEDDLTVSVGVEGVDWLEKSLRRVESAVKDVAKEVEESSASATLFVAGFFGGLKSLVASTTKALGEFGSAFAKMELRTGVSATTLSEYAYAAELAGAEISNVEGAIKGMQSYLTDAASGGADAAEKFARLGLSVEALARLSPEAQFEAISLAIAGVVDPTERAALAMAVFGDDGQALLPMFAEGVVGLQAMREEARAFGVSASDEATAGAEEFTAATTRLRTAVRGAGLAFAEVWTPAITGFANWLADMVAWVSNASRQFPALTGVATGAAAALGALGAGVTACNVVAPTFCSSLAAMRTAAVASCKGIATALTFLSAHPVFAVVAAIGAATAAVGLYLATRDDGLGKKWSDEAAQALEAGNAMREQDEGRLQRLQELAEKEELTKTEIAEAVSLAAELKSRYGDVGIEVDALTGKIKIAADAQAELNKRMLEAKRKETQAALDEAKANGADGVIERKIAEEEVGWDEALIGKKRGQSWSDWAFKDWSWYDSTADAKVAIASGDAGFQKRVAAAKAKNAAEIERLEAELAGLDAVLNAPLNEAGTAGGSDGANAASSETVAAKEAEAKAVEDLNARIAKAEEERAAREMSASERRIAAIKKETKELTDAIDARLEVLRASASTEDDFAEIYRLETAKAGIEADRDERVANVEKDDAAKAAQEAAKKEEAALQKVADFEARRAEEGKSNAEKRIDALRKETAEYKAQLQTLLDLEKAKPDGERDAKKVAELEGKIAGADAAGKKREGAVLAEAQEAYFEKFATPFEKFAKAQEEFRAASRELREAQESGDERLFAAALEKQGAARSKFESAESAISQAVGTAQAGATKPIVGTFSAYQAAADVYGAANDWEKKAFDEAKEQTRLLREIERKGGAVATFA